MGITGTYFPLRWAEISTNEYSHAVAIVPTSKGTFFVYRKYNAVLSVKHGGRQYTRTHQVRLNMFSGRAPESECEIPAMELLAQAIEDVDIDALWKEKS